MRCRELIRVLAWIIGGLFREGLACAWLVLALNPFWRLGETAILVQSIVNSMQIGHAVSEAQEKPSVSFI